MKHSHEPGKGRRVAEPVQVYLEPADRQRLERLTGRLGATKSDVLRRGLQALEAQTAAAQAAPAERLPLPTFAGRGLQPGVDLDDSAALLELMDREDPAAPR
jgi:Arc/MetJ-type ribon-helix-helix transcriptional regulator